MNNRYRLKKHFQITILTWLFTFMIGTVMTYYFIKYQPVVDPYIELWYPLVLVPIIYGIELYIYRKNKICVMSDHILFPRPYTRTKKEKLNYEEIEKITIKSDRDMEYLDSVINQEYHEYKISNRTGKETASDILEVLKKIIDEKNLDVDIVET